MTDTQSRLRAIPQISAVLEDARIRPLLAGRRREWVTRLVQQRIDALRADLRSAEGPAPDRGDLLKKTVQDVVEKYHELVAHSWTRVLNGTGVVVHTNLGRSNLPLAAVAAMSQVAAANTDLEFDLESGTRGHRGRRVEEKAALLAGAEDALIVNNNAAAVWLTVRLASREGPIVLSRGEIVAIGGSFRMNEILAETGCELVEVGTTNRTSLADYRDALRPGATVLKVHRSNFALEGFTEEVDLPELGELCRSLGCWLIYDAGSGVLHPMEDLGLPPGERLLAEDIAAGADLVTCSGDKLLGGCQAGIILGRRDRIAALRGHPMRRAFRVDKTTLAALDAVLGAYLAAEHCPDLPTLRQLQQDEAALERRARTLLAELAPLAPTGWKGQVVPGDSSVGGGSFSTAAVASRLVLWTAPKAALERCHRRLRGGDPALVGRMNQDGLAVDVRTLPDDEFPLVVAAFRRAWAGPEEA
jgi:L-seryl-tRNA(Ser) seleniumtransferase